MSSIPKSATLFVSIALVACTRPQDGDGSRKSSSGHEPTQETVPRRVAEAPPAPPPSPEPGTCEGACRHLVASCGTDPGRCVGECSAFGFDASTLARLQVATCDEAAELIEAHRRPPAGATTTTPSQGGGTVTCYARGIYEVCDGYSCRQRTVERFGIGETRARAELGIVQACASQMSAMVSVNRVGGRSAIRQPCRITTCQ